jgi:hypothetical protein
MWFRSVRDEKTGSRGPDGSPRGPDGLGIPSRSALASSRRKRSPHKIIIRRLEFALRMFKEGRPEWRLTSALRSVERDIQSWCAKNPAQKYPWSTPQGRPRVLDKDIQTLLRLRAANPDSDCRTEFERTTGVGKQRSRVRYQDADAAIAAMKSRSGKKS